MTLQPFCLDMPDCRRVMVVSREQNGCSHTEFVSLSGHQMQLFYEMQAGVELHDAFDNTLPEVPSNLSHRRGDGANGLSYVPHRLAPDVTSFFSRILLSRGSCREGIQGLSAAFSGRYHPIVQTTSVLGHVPGVIPENARLVVHSGGKQAKQHRREQPPDETVVR